MTTCRWVVFLSVSFLFSVGCVHSKHPTTTSDLGVPKSSTQLLEVMDTPGVVEVETVVSADWVVDREGLINLEHAKAKEAGLAPGEEPIKVSFHVLRHPTKGTFIVDTGVERAVKNDPEKAAVRGLVASAAKLDKMIVHKDLATWLKEQPTPLAGVFLTHLHLDHVLGLPDVPKTTPIYAGPGETTSRAFLNLLIAPCVDRALDGLGAIREWKFQPDSANRFAGVTDVFGDGSVWALWTPGHTPGHTAYLVRTPQGPVLLTGDVSHTVWGWDHHVEPGSFSVDKAQSAQSFAQLQKLAQEHPSLDVRLGHQMR